MTSDSETLGKNGQLDDFELSDLFEDDSDSVENSLLEEKQCEQQQLYEHFRLVADKGQEPMRIDRYLFDHMVYTSRNRIQKAAEAGCIFINDKPVKSNYKIRPLDVVTLLLDKPKHDNTIYPEDIPLDIVYEDESIMVINKPAGLVVHPGVGNFTGTMINAVAWHLKDNSDFDPNNPKVGLVHRIDKDTSGLVVVSKTPEAKTELGKQFYDKTTRRTYNALVWGNFTEDDGRIEGNIARDVHDRMRMGVYDPQSGIGKNAVTHYKVLERFGYTTFVECRLETGRTHQIRAHMTHLQHPLFADERYGGNEILRGQRSSSYRAFVNNCFATCPRQALHAKTLGFRHPITKEQMDFTSELPADMQMLLDKWRRYINGTTKDLEL